MLSVGDKIKMVTNVGKFNMVGEVFEITSLPDNEIHFFHKDWGFGYMSEDEFEKHFEKVEIRQWTDWIETKSGFSYRTDNKKYVKVKKDGCEVKAACHPCDEFNLAKGIAICLQKIDTKKNIKDLTNLCTSNDVKCKDENEIENENYFNNLSDEYKINLIRIGVDWYNKQKFDNYYINFSRININLDAE